MPNNPNTDSAISMILALQKRLDRIENSPQLGNTSIKAGALQILDPLDRLVLSVGYQPDGTIGVATYNPVTGAKVIEMGQQGDGTFGFAMYGPGAVKLLELGQLGPASTMYGLTVLQSGVMQQVSGAVMGYAPAQQVVPSAGGGTGPGGTWLFGDGPSQAVSVGPSGQALVTIGALITPPLTATEDGDVILLVDGVIPLDGSGNPLVHCLAGGAGTGGDISASATAIVTGLTPGVHTFSHCYTIIGGGGPAAVGNRFVVIIPF